MKTLALVLLAGIISAPAYAEDASARRPSKPVKTIAAIWLTPRRASRLRGGEASMRANGGTELRERWSPVAGFFGG